MGQPKTQFLPLCRELGITLIPYGPFRYAFFSGAVKNLEDIPQTDSWRRSMPRFQNENIGHNFQLLGALEEVTADGGPDGATERRLPGGCGQGRDIRWPQPAYRQEVADR